MNKDSFINQAVILAAGRGSRMLPLSRRFSKPMLPVLNKPILAYQIEALRTVGIKKIVIVIGFLGNQIRGHFGDGDRFGVKILYVSDQDPRGIAASLLRAQGKIQGSFFCLLGDIFVQPQGLVKSLSKMAKKGSKNVLLIKEEPLSNIIRLHAEVEVRGKHVIKLTEKPTNPKSNLRTCGIYLFTEDIFEAISKTPKSALRGEIELTDAIDKLIFLGRNVYFEKLSTWDINVTYESDLKECTRLIQGDFKT